MTTATLLVGGRVFTGRRYVESLLVEGPRVLAVGPESEVRRQAPTGTERLDLRSRLVVPGLADAHLHLGELARERQALDLRAVTSIPALLELFRSAAEQRPGAPLVGRGLDPERLAEQRWPTPGELDHAGSGRPVVVQHVSGHAAVANAAAVETGADGTTDPRRGPPQPGLLLEEELAVLRPVVQEALPLTPEGVQRTAQELVAFGITAVGTMNTGSEELAALRQLDADRRLPLQVRAYPPLGAAPDEATSGAGPGGRFAIAGVKGFLDGAFGPRTAWLRGPYTDDPSTVGVARGEDPALVTALEDAARHGLSPALHAIGDRAVERAVRLLRSCASGRAPSRIEHASLTPPELHGPLRAARLHLVVQPGFLLSDVWLGRRLGPERARWGYAFRTLRDLGMPLAGSSDAPFDEVDPWWGMLAAVRRRDAYGRSANPRSDEALPELESLGLYTVGAHAALGVPGGELVGGAPTSFVVLRTPRLGDALTGGRDAIQEVWVDGRSAVPASLGSDGRR